MGIPGALLALEPSDERIKGKFLRRVISRALPGGIAVAVCATLAMQMVHLGLPQKECSTVATWIAGLIGAAILWRTCRPLIPRRFTIAALSTAAFILAGLFFGHVFLLEPLEVRGLLTVAGMTAFGIGILFLVEFVERKGGFRRILKNDEEQR